MKCFPKFLVVFITISFIFGIGCSRERILRLKDKETIHWDEMIQDVKHKKIILIGEYQDDLKHHEYQLRLIKALHEQGIRVVVGLEMFRTNDQTVLDSWVSGKLTLDQFLPSYSANWYKPWPAYKDIFLFSREKKIPLIGLSVPAEIPAKVEKRGFASLSQEEVRQLPPGISCNVDDTYMEYIKRFYPARSSGKEFINFCEAQIIQDNAMALNALKYLERYPNSTAIILSEWNHAWKRAIPRDIERLRSGYTISVILPEFTKFERSIMTVEDADFLILQ
jgi:uncharacterized iron-regulated protein